MAHDHSHAERSGANQRSLLIALALTAVYLVAEVVGSILTGSLALLSDAAHMLTDVIALVIALAAIRVGRQPADAKRTFGYYRFEILAAALNASILFVVAAYILYEAWQRLQAPQEIQSMAMLLVAALGLVVNLISMRILQAGSEHSLNMKGAYLEVWSDMLGSVAVIIGAIVIRLTGWHQVDPILAGAIGLWVLPRTWKLLAESTNVLLEGVPEGLQLTEIEARLRALPGVRDVHDLHVWAITTGRNSLTAHLVIESSHGEQDVMRAARDMLDRVFAIKHTTVQVELSPCAPGDEHCR